MKQNKKLEKTKPAKNSPHTVRRSFLDYLRTEFPYKKDWNHPVGYEVEHASIKRVLQDYMEMDPSGYKALWYLWTTQGTRSFVAEQLNYSAPTVRRRWDKSINTLILMLDFPELKPKSFVLFNGITD